MCGKWLNNLRYEDDVALITDKRRTPENVGTTGHSSKNYRLQCELYQLKLQQKETEYHT